MQVYLYVFSKRRNSTARPTTAGASYSVVLKSPSSVVRPRIALVWTGSGDPVAYNYAYIPSYSRYYHIMEWTYSDRQWIADLSVDVLATCKNEIGSASKYVLRAAADMDGLVLDTKYPTKAGYTIRTSGVTSGLDPGDTGGNYIVGVISPGNPSYGSLNVWNLSASEFTALRNLLAPDDYYQNITDVDLQNLAIDIVNPMQYIAFVKYYPMQIVQGDVDTMQLGPLTMLAHKLAHPVVSFPNLTLNLTAHPLAASRGDYLSCEPYTQRFLSWLPIGMVHIPGLTSLLTSINVSYSLDLISGIGDLTITGGGAVLYRTSLNVGADIPIAQMTTGNPLKLLTGGINLMGSAASALTGNIGGAVTGSVSAISDFISSMIPEVQAMKPGGGSLLEDGTIRLIECFSNLVDDHNAEFGRPLCKVRQISTLSGYVLCADGEISAAVTAGELAEIESFLTGGFFYE